MKTLSSLLHSANTIISFLARQLSTCGVCSPKHGSLHRFKSGYKFLLCCESSAQPKTFTQLSTFSLHGQKELCFQMRTQTFGIQTSCYSGNYRVEHLFLNWKKILLLEKWYQTVLSGDLSPFLLMTEQLRPMYWCSRSQYEWDSVREFYFSAVVQSNLDNQDPSRVRTQQCGTNHHMARDAAWRNVTRRDVTWRDVTWRDVTWRDATWRDATWRDVTWRDATWCDATQLRVSAKCSVGVTRAHRT